MADATPIRILLVDDEPSILEMFATYLQFCGFEVIKAEDGEQALRLIRDTQPQVIVLDIKMPRMDGWEACRRIKADPKTCGIPVIFLTAYDQIQDRQNARQLGVQGYVTKPCEPSVLVQAIQQVIHRILPEA
jgi:CheY-like chemotaxis protein